MEISKKGNLHKVQICKAKLDDYESIRELLVNENMTTVGFFTKSRFETALQKFGKYYLVARKDNKIVGCISGFDDTGIFYGYMCRLAIDPAYRRQGIAEILIKTNLMEFKRSGVGIVFVGVKNSNHASRELLKKCGFEEDGSFQTIQFFPKQPSKALLRSN